GTEIQKGFVFQPRSRLQPCRKAEQAFQDRQVRGPHADARCEGQRTRSVSAHTRILAYLREQVQKPDAPCVEYFTDRTDAQMMRTIFYSFRGGEEPRGLRLSPTGFNILTKFFRPYDITLPDGYRIGSADML